MKYGVFVLLSIFMLNCSNDTPISTLEEELGPNATIIRNPVADPELSANEAARMNFRGETHEFGTVDQGAVLEHEFSFVNVGEAPLLIADARSTCGCTVADHPREPVAPGDSATITVRFDTANKSGRQKKSVAIRANTNPSLTYLYVSGIVTAENN